MTHSHHSVNHPPPSPGTLPVLTLAYANLILINYFNTKDGATGRLGAGALKTAIMDLGQETGTAETLETATLDAAAPLVQRQGLATHRTAGDLV